MNLSYRDEMPPTPEKKKIKLIELTPRTLLFIGIGIGAIILAIVLLIWAGSGGVNTQLQHLSARLDTMQTIANDSNRSIRDPDLRKFNSDLRLLTTGSINKLREPMAAVGMTEVSGGVRAQEADSATIERLERAKSGGDFDIVYARVTEQKIDTLIALMQEIYDESGNNNLRQALSESYTDFATLRQELSENIEL